MEPIGFQRVEYNARNSAAVKLVTNGSQWRKIDTRGRRRKGRGALNLRTALFARNPERQSFLHCSVQCCFRMSKTFSNNSPFRDNKKKIIREDTAGGGLSSRIKNNKSPGQWGRGYSFIRYKPANRGAGIPRRFPPNMSVPFSLAAFTHLPSFSIGRGPGGGLYAIERVHRRYISSQGQQNDSQGQQNDSKCSTLDAVERQKLILRCTSSVVAIVLYIRLVRGPKKKNLRNATSSGVEGLREPSGRRAPWNNYLTSNAAVAEDCARGPTSRYLDSQTTWGGQRRCRIMRHNGTLSSPDHQLTKNTTVTMEIGNEGGTGAEVRGLRLIESETGRCDTYVEKKVKCELYSHTEGPVPP
ncbi:hypothetical protein EVAR_77465_1 [Eumeta japonica]|uniref:Uncharacterized protein n=1 Tax=Eumeta variegata TaxID=151549 RepID=A0A4C1ZVF5_EUMVA|nr:hypothetical protein EVAR_77465_1 [Eumeta japonica]